MSITTPEQDVLDAEALYEALQVRVRDGDETITAQEVEQAKSLAEFARLRKEGTYAKARRAAQARAAAEVAEAATEVEVFLDSISGNESALEKLRDAAAEAVTAYTAALYASKEAGVDLVARLEAADIQARNLHVPDSWSAERSARLHAENGTCSMLRDGQRVEWKARVSPRAVMDELVEPAGFKVVDVRGPRGEH